MPIQAVKIGFGMRENYLEPTHHRSVVRPIPIRTKFSNYSGTPLKQTPPGQCHLSFIERCP